MKSRSSFFLQKTEIDFEQTLTCGQIFSYKKTPSGYLVFSGKNVAEVTEHETTFEVQTSQKEFFLNFFDVKTDYSSIKNALKQFDVMKNPLTYGAGIRILRQDLLETIISFAISANNNIKRITNSVFFLRENFGEVVDGYHAFPTLKKLLTLTKEDFQKAGTGYRSAQLVKLVKQLAGEDFFAWGNLSTQELREKLVGLSGVGPKVADCVLLFGYGRTDVFPVDTWIEKVYNNYFEPCTNRLKIRRNLVDKFKNLSGYAQQYLFFYQRSKKL